MELLVDEAALGRVFGDAIRDLTEAALDKEGATPEQLADNRRVVEMSAATCEAAARDPRRHLVVAMIDGRFAGYLIATVHGDDDRELDWLMVHPLFHGRGVAGPLMAAGVAWLGPDREQWLNVIGDNARAIGFYRKYGFEVDAAVRSGHPVPRVIMRRTPSPRSSCA